MFSSNTATTCHTKSTSRTRSNSENAIGNSNCHTLKQARKYIHEAFQTAEQRQAEKLGLGSSSSSSSAAVTTPDKVVEDAKRMLPPIAEEEATPSSIMMSETTTWNKNSALEQSGGGGGVEYKLLHRLHENVHNNRLALQHGRPFIAEKVLSASSSASASSTSDTSLNSGFSPEFLKSVEDLSQVWPNDGSKGNKLGRK